MSNYLENGAVLPSGLLGDSISSQLAGFNKSYKDTALRAGVVVASYPISDPENRTKLSTEYDVVTTQQDEDRGATTIRYKKCLAQDSFGGVADFFEMNFRAKTQQTYTGDAVRFSGQNGSIVLLLCLDGTSNKAMIIGGFPNPDRDTTLVDTDPRLQGEYNGVNIKVNPDGSTALTFKGATNNDGTPVDASQGNTVVAIATDGSFSVTNTATTFNMAKSGDVTITAIGKMIVNTSSDTIVNASGNSNIIATGNIDITAGGNVDIKAGSDVDITASGNIVLKAANIDLNGTASGITTANSHMQVIDLITNVPVIPSTTTFGDV